MIRNLRDRFTPQHNERPDAGMGPDAGSKEGGFARVRALRLVFDWDLSLHLWRTKESRERV